jgi:hypothetical protein
MVKNDFGLLFWVHLLVILIYISTPFWLGWQWVLLLVALFYLQNKLFKNCVLTNAQLKDREDVDESERSFYTYYFQKAGLKVNPRWVKKYFAYTLLWVFFIVSIFWQMDLAREPLLVSNLF